MASTTGLPVRRRDEIGSLARSFAHMADRLHGLMGDLERKVQIRTAELERSNGELVEARDKALAGAQAKVEFLATMSHEIRTPLNGVIGMTGLLLHAELTAEPREYGGIIRTSGEHLLNIVNDILDFSRIESGKLTIEEIEFDLQTAVQEAGDLLAERAFGCCDPRYACPIRTEVDTTSGVMPMCSGIEWPGTVVRGIPPEPPRQAGLFAPVIKSPPQQPLRNETKQPIE